MKKGTFKVEWIIELLKRQQPKRLDLIQDLEKVGQLEWFGKPYVEIVDSKNANQPNSNCQFEENIILEHKIEGTIVLDVLKNGKVGGIEFLKYILHS